MKFTKMHGCGNDYIYINGFTEKIENENELAKKLSDRHFSIGGDGVVLILPSNVADAKMRMFNADGSEGKMCGNAIRCVGKYLFDNKIVCKKKITIETLSGIKQLSLSVKDEKVESAVVNMGEAILHPKDIPALLDGLMVIDREVEIAGKKQKITLVSMGNPHCIVFVDNMNFEIEKIGSEFENSPLFPDRINTEFVRVISEKEIDMRVWERGSGETLACGTGACASVVACVVNGKCRKNEEVKVNLIGGQLFITFDGKNVIMKGGCTEVFKGEINL